MTARKEAKYMIGEYIGIIDLAFGARDNIALDLAKDCSLAAVNMLMHNACYLTTQQHYEKVKQEIIKIKTWPNK